MKKVPRKKEEGPVDRTFEDMYHAVMKLSNGGDYFLITFTGGLQCLAALPMNHGDPESDGQKERLLCGDALFCNISKGSL